MEHLKVHGQVHDLGWELMLVSKAVSGLQHLWVGLGWAGLCQVLIFSPIDGFDKPNKAWHYIALQHTHAQSNMACKH